MHRRSVSMKQLQSLAENWNLLHCALDHVVYFCQGCFDTIATMEEGVSVRMNHQIKKDVLWWLVYMEGHKRVSIMWMDDVEDVMSFSKDAFVLLGLDFLPWTISQGAYYLTNKA